MIHKLLEAPLRTSFSQWKRCMRSCFAFATTGSSLGLLSSEDWWRIVFCCCWLSQSLACFLQDCRAASMPSLVVKKATRASALYACAELVLRWRVKQLPRLRAHNFGIAMFSLQTLTRFSEVEDSSCVRSRKPILH